MLRRSRVEKTVAARATERAEAFRVLRSNLLVAINDLDSPVVVVTSSLPGEGKTTTCVDLARSLSEAGMRVVLVDLDLRSPQAHQHMGTEKVPGCTEALLDQRPLEECLQFVPAAPDASPGTGLYFLPAGSGVPDPAELLSTPRTGRLLEALSTQADIVLVDTPPVLPVADTLIIGRLSAGALLVVEARRTPVQAVQRTKTALIRNQTRLLGVALNRMRPSDDDAQVYGYGADFADVGEQAIPPGGRTK